MNAGDIMSRSLLAVREEAPLEQAVRLMIDNRIAACRCWMRPGAPSAS